MSQTNPKVVVIGGGTGSFVLLSGLKEYPVDLYAVVAMSDSGGSTGRLRDQMGVLPPGDLRQALVALSESPEIWKKLFAYRFDGGDLAGHNFGNLFLSVFQRLTGSIDGAVEEASKVLKVKGTVVPVTFSMCTLCAKYEDGSVIEGESLIDESLTKRPRIDSMYLSPEAMPNPKALQVIKDADFIIFSPGDLYTSVVPNFLVHGITQALSESSAKKIYVLNLMTKRGQTDGFNASDFVYEIEKYSNTFLDYVIANTSKPDQETLTSYKKTDNVDLVDDDLDEKKVTEARVIRADTLSSEKYNQNPSDRVKRSAVKHDPDKLAGVILDIIKNHTGKVLTKNNT